MYQGSCKKCFLRLLGGNMFLFSLITIGLGIADLYLTYQTSCTSGGCQFPLNNGIILTWVGVAIWAPIPIFFNGIAAIWIASRPAAEKSWVCVLSFFNLVAFGPVIVVVTALELVNKHQYGVSPGVQNAIFIIEIAICVVGGVLTLHALAVMYLNCCCRSCIDQGMAHPLHHQYQRHYQYPHQHESQVVIREIEAAPSHDIGRMNLWSAQRWADNGRSAAAVTPCRCAGVPNSGYSCGCHGGYSNGPIGFGGGASASRPKLVFSAR